MTHGRGGGRIDEEGGGAIYTNFGGGREGGREGMGGGSPMMLLFMTSPLCYRGSRRLQMWVRSMHSLYLQSVAPHTHTHTHTHIHIHIHPETHIDKQPHTL